MTTLNFEAKLAALKVLDEILLADGKVNNNEIAFLNSAISMFELSDDVIHKIKEFHLLHALEIIKELDLEQRNHIASLMGKMIIVDGDINYNEVRLYNHVCDYCGISESFNTTDYEGCSLSGPFSDVI